MKRESQSVSDLEKFSQYDFIHLPFVSNLDKWNDDLRSCMCVVEQKH